MCLPSVSAAGSWRRCVRRNCLLLPNLGVMPKQSRRCAACWCRVRPPRPAPAAPPHLTPRPLPRSSSKYSPRRTRRGCSACVRSLTAEACPPRIPRSARACQPLSRCSKAWARRSSPSASASGAVRRAQSTELSAVQEAAATAPASQLNLLPLLRGGAAPGRGRDIPSTPGPNLSDAASSSCTMPWESGGTRACRRRC